MRLFNPVDSFDSFFSITRRQTDTICWGGLGAGECLSSCPGVVYSNQCRDSAGEECCLNSRCSTDVGDGFCRNNENQTCEGEWVVGSGPVWPCSGPNYIVCCVRWEDMVNGTETSTSNTSTSTPTSSSSSSTASSTMTTTAATNGPSPTETASESNSSSGLTSAQKGGIAGGVVGAVTVTSLVFLLLWWLRRRIKRKQQGPGNGGESAGGGADEDGGDDRAATETVTTAGEGQDQEGEEAKGVAMLGSREKQELDGSGRALHEMDSDSTVTPIGNEKGTPETKTKRLAELPGSMAPIAEMPVPEERRE
ncbi:hypothetical protein BJX63DRAFT_107398 [Aspergillus granulosus]|uniref:Uncharacterized protein n=1 Tax=Aspergillus granulosus TaxID=176169 RepID=A0ABR4GTZ0_9EURO